MGENHKAALKLTFLTGVLLPNTARLLNVSIDGNARRAADIHGVTWHTEVLKLPIRVLATRAKAT